MRFDKEVRALVHKADPNPVTIPWPPGAPEPQKGRIYWFQSEEDAEQAAKKAKARREYSPETHAEVLAGMHRRLTGNERKLKTKRRRRSTAMPKAGDPRLLVIDVTVLGKGFEAKVALYEDPDPVNHLRVKGKVKYGPNPIFLGEDLEPAMEPTQLEPEQLLEPDTHHRRLEEEAAMKKEHELSLDMSKVMKAEQTLLDQRRRGKSGKLATAAIKRAKNRATLDSAGEAA